MECFVEKPLLPWRVHVPRNTDATERLLRQDKSSACQGRQRRSPKHEKVAPALITQNARSHLNCREGSLSKEALRLFHGDGFHYRFHTVEGMSLFFLIAHFAMTSDRAALVDQPKIILRNVSHPSAKTRITCGPPNRK